MTTRRIEELFDRTVQSVVREDATFLTARQFLSLATSRRKLLRADGSGSTVLGLFDPETGKRYLIEAKQLTGA